jgi:hypothetical protein
MGVAEGRARVALHQREAEHAQQGRVGVEGPGFVKVFVAVREQHLPAVHQAHCLRDFGDLALQDRSQRGGRGGVRLRFVVDLPLGHHPEHAVAVGVKVVVAQFVLHPEQDEDAGGHAHSEAQQVDEGKSLAFPQAPQGDDEVVVEHWGPNKETVDRRKGRPEAGTGAGSDKVQTGREKANGAQGNFFCPTDAAQWIVRTSALPGALHQPPSRSSSGLPASGLPSPFLRSSFAYFLFVSR